MARRRPVLAVPSSKQGAQYRQGSVAGGRGGVDGDSDVACAARGSGRWGERRGERQGPRRGIPSGAERGTLRGMRGGEGE